MYKKKKAFHRNDIKQVVPLFDKESGNKIGEKVIWHQKKFNMPQYGDFMSWWRSVCRTPNPNSKRQIKLRQEEINNNKNQQL